ncbi:hypothetical protein [Nonomuraea dietziae]|uniref:hypothetical protein n=1 Tax=Nonomuraea dietziae TaxID=65515 RepID=UPI0033E4591C
MRANATRTSELIGDEYTAEEDVIDETTGEISTVTVRKHVDVSFAPEAWQQVITDKRRPGKVVRRDFEICVFSCLADELVRGDAAAVGSRSSAIAALSVARATSAIANAYRRELRAITCGHRPEVIAEVRGSLRHACRSAAGALQRVIVINEADGSTRAAAWMPLSGLDDGKLSPATIDGLRMINA